MNSDPKISVIIPTHCRPVLVATAVNSALAQTYRNIEIIVVIDGCDPETFKILRDLGDSRLIVLETGKQGGAQRARNFGIDKASGAYIALLDDDDEWFPEKLETQFRKLISTDFQRPIVVSKFVRVSEHGRMEWPHEIYEGREHFSEYIMGRKGFLAGVQIIQTSTILAPTSLFRDVRFDIELRKFQDWDWLLRASALEGVGIEFVKQPLSLFNAPQNRTSISTRELDWRSSVLWAESLENLVSRKAFASFLLIDIGAMAATKGDWKAFIYILERALGTKVSSLQNLLVYISYWLLSPNLLSVLRRLARRVQNL